MADTPLTKWTLASRPRADSSIGDSGGHAAVHRDGHIFVSYARRDKDIVDREIEGLERLGFPVWCDRRDIHAGIEWSAELDRAIDACACLLVFATHNSVGSEWVAHEIACGLAQGKPIVIVYWEQAEFPAELNDRLQEIQGIPRYCLHQPEYEDLLRRSLSRHCRAATSTSGDSRFRGFAEVEIAEPTSSRPVVSPRLLFFLLVMFAVAIYLLALVAFVAPLFVEPPDPLANKLHSRIAGSACTAVGFGLSVAAFCFYRIYVQKAST